MSGPLPPVEPSEGNPGGLLLEVVRVAENPDFEVAYNALKHADTKTFMSHLGAIELYDYDPLDKILRQLTAVVHEIYPGQVRVIPRGSYASRTALAETADLDIDFVFLQDTELELSVDDQPPETKTIREALGVDQDLGTVTFDRDKLFAVLSAVWAKLSEAMNPDIPDENLLQLADPHKKFTRSIPCETVAVIDGLDRNIAVDVFIKVQVKREAYQYTVGVDKDGPDQLRRYQVTDSVPIQGKWFDRDRILKPEERCAILMLKWWKIARKLGDGSKIPVKSHHLLSALNALTQLSDKDTLYLPPNESVPFSCLRVIERMRGIIIYLHLTYAANNLGFLLQRPNAKGAMISDYPVPEVNRGLQDNMFIQFNQEDGGKPYQAFKQPGGDFLQAIEKDLDAAAKHLRNQHS